MFEPVTSDPSGQFVRPVLHSCVSLIHPTYGRIFIIPLIFFNAYSSVSVMNIYVPTKYVL